MGTTEWKRSEGERERQKEKQQSIKKIFLSKCFPDFSLLDILKHHHRSNRFPKIKSRRHQHIDGKHRNMRCVNCEEVEEAKLGKKSFSRHRRNSLMPGMRDDLTRWSSSYLIHYFSCNQWNESLGMEIFVENKQSVALRPFLTSWLRLHIEPTCLCLIHILDGKMVTNW